MKTPIVLSFIACILLGHAYASGVSIGKNEASGIETMSPTILTTLNAAHGFWIVGDENKINDSDEDKGPLFAFTKGAEDGASWTAVQIPLEVTGIADANDGEAIFRHGEFIYAIGSHFGKKMDGTNLGHLDADRQFILRFRESDYTPGESLPVLVRQNDFQLHRSINDAFGETENGITPVPNGAALSEMVGGANHPNVKSSDHPLNIEGAAVTANGELLLGLRFPVTTDFEPIIVRLGSWENQFTDPAVQPVVLGFYAIENIGTADEISGIRGMAIDKASNRLHLLAGSIGKDPSSSQISRDYPQGDHKGYIHVEIDLPANPGRLEKLTPAQISKIDTTKFVEGITLDADNRVWYVYDDDTIEPVRAD